MFAFTTIATSHWYDAKKFYDELFSIIHIKSFFEEDGLRGYGTEESQPYFSIRETNGLHKPSTSDSAVIALNCGTPNRVNLLYNKAIELGAIGEEKPSGQEGGMYYSASIRDLDGNKLALHARPAIKLEVPKIFRRGRLQFRDMASVRSGIRILNYVEPYKTVKNSIISGLWVRRQNRASASPDG